MVRGDALVRLQMAILPLTFPPCVPLPLTCVPSLPPIGESLTLNAMEMVGGSMADTGRALSTAGLARVCDTCAAVRPARATMSPADAVTMLLSDTVPLRFTSFTTCREATGGGGGVGKGNQGIRLTCYLHCTT